MNETQLIAKMAAAANRDPHPRIDAVNPVLSEIRKRHTLPLKTIGWLAALASVATVGLSILAIQAWQLVNDPLSDMFVVANLVTL